MVFGAETTVEIDIAGEQFSASGRVIIAFFLNWYVPGGIYLSRPMQIVPFYMLRPGGTAKIDRWRSIEGEIDRRLSIEGEIDRRLSIEGEKGKKKKKRKRRKKKRRKREKYLLAYGSLA
ncbi:hypothetical protein B296_00046998 [Ensete ventricosum]|uniref:Uncharacterized protein n=1 Tax=Ensete ventricosum TaxID=4639 RepID=A0A426XP09_ENSVE|nr:hypothetical protein B296_00046998 [Ensete ventricosum]